jgi:hypothetical protein
MVRDSGMKPDATQERFLRDRSERKIMDCTRQFGKSTVTGAEAYCEAICYGGTLVLMLGPSQRQAGELFRKAMAFHYDLNQPVRTKNESVMSVEFENNSRIVSLPGKEATVRSFSAVGLLIVDEAARVADALYYSVRPMLAVTKVVKGAGGRLAALSSPFGRMGWYHDAWAANIVVQEGAGALAGYGVCELCHFEEIRWFFQERRLCKYCIRSEGQWEQLQHLDDEWSRYRVIGEECERIPPEFLEAEREAVGPYWYRQEYCCQFLDTVDSYFDSVALDRSLEWDGEKLFGDVEEGPASNWDYDDAVEPLFDFEGVIE